MANTSIDVAIKMLDKNSKQKPKYEKIHKDLKNNSQKLCDGKKFY